MRTSSRRNHSARCPGKPWLACAGHFSLRVHPFGAGAVPDEAELQVHPAPELYPLGSTIQRGHTMYPNTLALARSLSKTVIAYDLEHTGIAGEHHCITDFGAMLVTPAGDISSYASLVRPPEGTQFNR